MKSLKICATILIIFLGCSSTKHKTSIQFNNVVILKKAIPVDSLNFIVVELTKFDPNLHDKYDIKEIHLPDSTDENNFQYLTPFYYRTSPAIYFRLQKDDSVSFHLDLNELMWNRDLFKLFLFKGDYTLSLSESHIPKGIYRITRKIGDNIKGMNIKF